jgi:negative regulator of sigma E activity
MMSSEELRDRYEARVLGEEELAGRACWKLEMTATDESVAYPRRVSWIDGELFIPLKQELYALSGMLLKTWTMEEIQEFEGGRRFPARMVVEDHLKKESRTIIEFTGLEFGVELEEEVFSMRWLERK